MRLIHFANYSFNCRHELSAHPTLDLWTFQLTLNFELLIVQVCSVDFIDNETLLLASVATRRLNARSELFELNYRSRLIERLDWLYWKIRLKWSDVYIFADSNIIACSRFAQKPIQNWFSVVSRVGSENVIVQRNRMEIVQCTQPLVRKEVSERQMKEKKL